MSEAIPAIYAALGNVMDKVQGIGKNRRTTGGGANFSFRGVDDVVNVVGPVLREEGVIVVPYRIDEVREERYVTKGGTPMHGCVIRITWRFYAADGSHIEAASAGQSSDSGDKSVPKAHSVAYRTVLLQALCIPTDEPQDPDENVHERADERPVAAAPDERLPLFSEIKAIGALRKLTEAELADDFEAWSQGTKIGASTPEQLTGYIEHLKKPAEVTK